MDAAPAILLVEDDAEQAYLFVDELKMNNYAVTAVSTAEEAFTALATAPYALALVDLELPDLSGDVVITRMKARYPGMKAVLFSNHPHLQQIAAACGADAAFRKLESIFELGVLIADVLNTVA